ncbi:MAG TPA: PH domain-containing protein [Solirubrobacteraceae bacterium]|nr:PH domain-containing protein [Solirubrobacteraceae bacterium]
MSSDALPGADARRLHRAGIVVLAVEALRDAALPMLVIAVVGLVGGGFDAAGVLRALALAAAGGAVAAVAGALGWATTRWWLDDGAIRVKTGLLSTRIVDIPLTRVQSIDTVRGPVQRLFGVQGVHVQTAGGGKEGEIKLVALDAADLAVLRAAIAGRRPEAVAREEEPATRRRLERRSLLVAALTSGQVGVLVPVLAALPQVVDQLAGGDLEDAGREGVRLVPDSAAEWVLAGGALLAVAWLLAILGTIAAFAGFEVARRGERLRIRRGLLARRESTVTVARVQAVLVVEGILRRPFGLASLRVEVAGFKAEAAAAQTLFPLLRRRDVPGFLAALLPEHADALDGLAPPPSRARRRYLLPPALAGLALGAALWLALPAAGPWPLVLALPGLGAGALAWSAAGWRVRDGRVAVRSRRLARVTVLAPARALQEVARSQSPLQRHGGLADLHLAVGAGTRARVRHLDERVATGAYDALR